MRRSIAWALVVVALWASAGGVVPQRLAHAQGISGVSQAAVSAQAATPVYTYQIINVYPHRQWAYTEGLAWDNGSLYEGTGLNGRSGIRRVDLATGNVVQYRALPQQYFGEGITVVGNRLIELTWTSHVGFIYDKNTFNLLGQFSYPTQGWGLTYDGTHLLMSDGTSVIHFLDPNTFAEVNRISVHDGSTYISKLNELEYINGQIFANVWLTDRIARINPATGQVTAWIDLSGLRPPQTLSNQDAVLNGIAWDPAGKRFFVTGKLWNKLYQLKLVLK